MKSEALKRVQKYACGMNLICFSILLLALGLASGCSGQLYRVASVPKVAAPEFKPELSEAKSTLMIVANKLTGDELMTQFDANLLLAGVIVVDVRARNDDAIAHPLAFALSDNLGAVFQPLVPKKALQKVMKYYGNRLYAKAAYQQTLSQYESLAFPLGLSLEAKAERRGFLFFAPRGDATALSSLQLATTSQAATLKTVLQ